MTGGMGMRLDVKRSIMFVAAFTLLWAGSIFASSAVPSAGPPDDDHLAIYLSGRASTLLAEIQQETAELTPHADTLKTFTWAPQYSWQSHAEYLHRVKGHIN